MTRVLVVFRKSTKMLKFYENYCVKPFTSNCTLLNVIHGYHIQIIYLLFYSLSPRSNDVKNYKGVRSFHKDCCISLF